MVYSAGAPNDPTIGGGQLYAVEEDNAIIEGDFVVENMDALKEALDIAEPNQIIFMPSSVQIDFTNESSPLLIPEGITIAGDRGVDGSKGALLFSSNKERNTALLKVIGDNVRITGFRVRGPHENIQNDYYNRGISSQNNSGLIIDNMEIFNWANSGVKLNNGTDNAQIHHCSIHSNQRNGNGYGVVLDGEANAVIHHNLFDSNRHSIAGSGHPGQIYEAHSNIIFANSNGHALDMHGYYEWAGPRDDKSAGEYVNIHDNTFLVTLYAIVIRGVPSEGVVITDNKFVHEEESKAIKQIVLGELVVNCEYQGEFNVFDNEYDQAGNMKYADFDEDKDQYSKLSNDVLWAVPRSGSTLKDWYVSLDGKEPWEKLSASIADIDQLQLNDFDDDGISDVFNALWGEWEISSGGVGHWKTWNTSQTIIEDLIFGDFNGDGVADVVHKNWKFVSWNGSSQWESDVLHDNIDFTQQFFNIDIGNDGQTDIVRPSGLSFEVSWGGQTDYETVNAHSFIHSGHGHGDFNGDGKKDLFRISDSNWEVCYYGNEANDSFEFLSGDHNEKLSEIALGDFNGDGITDIFRISNNQWQYSDGGVGQWQNLNWSSVSLSRLAFGDFNGDGKTDIFCIGSDAKWKVSWGGETNWETINSSNLPFSRLIFSDFNGDGRTDVAVFNNGNVKVSLGGTQPWKIWN